MPLIRVDTFEGPERRRYGRFIDDKPIITPEKPKENLQKQMQLYSSLLTKGEPCRRVLRCRHSLTKPPCGRFALGGRRVEFS